MENSEFQLVTDTDGNLIGEGDKILAQRISDGILVYINRTEGLPQASTSQVEKADEQMRNIWSRQEILDLIQLYKEHETQFKSTTIKNDKVWQNISAKLITRNWEQCKNKFKYLKSKYSEKKDNMSTRASGAKNIKFEYFEEMDDIFRSYANIQPVAIASSSRGIHNITDASDVLENHESNVEENKNKRCANKQLLSKSKKIKISETIYEEVQQMKEDGRNKRHDEKIKVQKELVSAIKDLLAVLKPRTE